MAPPFFQKAHPDSINSKYRRIQNVFWDILLNQPLICAFPFNAMPSTYDQKHSSQRSYYNYSYMKIIHNFLLWFSLFQYMELVNIFMAMLGVLVLQIVLTYFLALAMVAGVFWWRGWSVRRFYFVALVIGILMILTISTYVWLL